MNDPTCALGTLAPRFENVRRIAVLRGGGLGDVMFAVPAMYALAAAYPDAEITLLGTPLHHMLFAGRPGPVRHVEVLPFAEGVRPGPEDPAEVAAFRERMRARSFDLAVQLHGGGRFSNPFLLDLGARHTVGSRTHDAAPLERNIGYHYYQHEVLRALEVVGLAGAAPVLLAPLLETTTADHESAADVLSAADRVPGQRPRLAIHPGATDERRHWAAERFAAVARWAAEDGFEVLVVGDDSEKALAEEIVRLAAIPGSFGRSEPAGPLGELHLAPGAPLADGPGGVRSVAGRVDIGGLAGLLAACDVVLGNDSGPRHLAQAVGTPTVGVYWVGNMIMAGALDRGRHRVHLGWATACSVCGADVTQVGWSAPNCGHVFPLNDAVRPQDVYADVLDLACRRRGVPSPWDSAPPSVG